MATTALSPATETYRRSWVLDWLTTVDHKKIGILYIVNSFIFFFAAGILALVVRSELAVPGLQFLDERTYNQAFTMHGTIMIFLFVVPVLSGFGNYIVPLMIGAPDMAFPRINALSFWFLPLGGILIFSGYLFGGAAAEGWTLYAPLSDGTYSSRSRHRPVADRAHPGRYGVDPGLGQLHRHHLQDARARHDPLPDADLGLDRARHPGPDPARHPGAGGRHDRPLHRPQLRRQLLRPECRRRIRSCGSTSSGSSATRRCTSSSCRRWAW